MRLIVKNRGGETVDEITNGLKGIIPKMKGYAGMIEKGKTSFNNVTVFTFNDTVLLMSVGIRDSMSNTTFVKIF
jgi:L-serine deaminase